MSILQKYPLASSAALSMAVAAALSACGGGSDTPASTPSTPVGPTPVSKSVPVKVIDGAIKNALVCLDKNTNGACDEGEPFARTDVGGNATLSVPEADAGKFPMLALVGTDALIAVSLGRSRVFNSATDQNGSSGTRNESWGLSTLSVGPLAG